MNIHPQEQSRPTRATVTATEKTKSHRYQFRASLQPCPIRRRSRPPPCLASAQRQILAGPDLPKFHARSVTAGRGVSTGIELSCFPTRPLQRRNTSHVDSKSGAYYTTSDGFRRLGPSEGPASGTVTASALHCSLLARCASMPTLPQPSSAVGCGG
jgi:hypothetical protein